MQERLLPFLHQTSLSGLVDFAARNTGGHELNPTEEETATLNEKNEAEKKVITAQSQALADKINLKKLSNADLIELCKACDLDYNYVRHRESIPCSSRIILCASKTQITDLQAHDTIITPDGVWQINEDFEETSILTKKEMTSALASNLLPNMKTELTILASNDELPNNTDDANTTQAKQMTEALNLAFIKKPNSLYIGQSESKKLQRTVDALRALKQNLLVPEILFRKLHHLILNINHLKSDVQLIQLSQKISNSLQALIDKGRKKPGAADEELDYILKTFPQHTQFKNLSENDLKMLAYIASIYPFTYSSRIIVARSIDAINASDIELQEHDTIILPDKIAQIDKKGRAHSILTKQEMPAYLAELIPEDNTLVQEITDESTIRKLNQTLQNQPNALYITNPESMQKERSTFIAMLSAINQLAENEHASRETSNNLFLQALSFKTDAEFLHYYWGRMHIAPNSKEPAAFEAHVQKVLADRTELSNLPDAQLKKLIRQCRIWTPKISHRILCSRVLPTDCEIGDTVILPTGVYQIRLNSHGQVTQEMIIDQKTMESLYINDFLPDTKTQVTLYDDLSNPQAKELIYLLNPHIAGHLKGMYLCETPRASEGYGMVNIVLQKMAEQVLRARRLEQYRSSNTPKSFFNFGFGLGLGFGIFGSAKKVVPAAEPTQLGTIAPARTKLSIRDLRKTAKNVKKFQKSLQSLTLAERVVPNPSTMLVHTERSQAEEKTPHSPPSLVSNIIDTLDLAFQKTHSQTFDPIDESVKIKLHEEVVMEFDKNSVAIYKPLIKTKAMQDREKAELFLKALGIPPTTGKHGVEVKGGHRPLRKAIRELFKEYKETEHLQKKKSQFKRQRNDSDTGSELSSNSGSSFKKH